MERRLGSPHPDYVFDLSESSGVDFTLIQTRFKKRNEIEGDLGEEQVAEL